MRGDDQHPDGMFSYVSPEARIPATHPLRPMRAMVDQVLRELSPAFRRLYATTGRPIASWPRPGRRGSCPMSISRWVPP